MLVLEECFILRLLGEGRKTLCCGVRDNWANDNVWIVKKKFFVRVSYEIDII